MQKLVSIIVPVYNVEKYIDKCVRSLLKQDYGNIEVILVDDGSPDKSGYIIDRLKEEDNRIVVIHQENHGVSSARNAGMAVASGEYITFVDGDDWVDANYVTYFVDLLEKSSCDVAMNKNNYSGCNDISNNNFSVISAEKAIEWIYLGDLFVAVWNKMYRRSVLEENYIKFNERIWYGEGMLFNVEFLQHVNSVAVGESAVYHQTFNPDSAMRKFNLKSNLCGIKSLELQKEAWIKKNIDIEKAWEYHRYCFNRSIIDGLVRSNMILEYGCYMKERGKLLTNTVVTTVMSNFGLYKAFDEQGIGYAKTAVGDKYVYEYMAKNGCRIGGEQSGHIIFSKYASTGDGILTSLKMMEVMLAKKKPMSELAAALKIYPQVLENVRVTDKKAAQNDEAVQTAVKNVAEALGDTGRILVRESGTEPVVRVMVEAPDHDTCQKYVSEVVNVIRDRGYSL